MVHTVQSLHQKSEFHSVKTKSLQWFSRNSCPETVAPLSAGCSSFVKHSQWIGFFITFRVPGMQISSCLSFRPTLTAYRFLLHYHPSGVDLLFLLVVSTLNLFQQLQKQKQSIQNSAGAWVLQLHKHTFLFLSIFATWVLVPGSCLSVILQNHSRPKVPLCNILSCVWIPLLLRIVS